MIRINVAVLVALAAVFVTVTSESSKSWLDESAFYGYDENEPPEQNQYCESIMSTESNFNDPTFYWRLLKDLLGTRTKMPEEVVCFALFTKELGDNWQLVRVDDDSLLRSGFNASRPTRFLIHGWLSHSNAEFSRSVKDAYLKIGDFNVIIVDWSMLSQTINYYKAAEVVEDIGQIVANFAKHLNTEFDVDFNDIYLIGHSLGAHIAGSAGKWIQPDKFNTIFALDPAGPAFRGEPMDCVIDASDAKYVESIQTSTSLGIDTPVGHATFFPNKGIYQGCLVYGCAHKRAYKYFAESITSNRGFWGTRCYEEENGEWTCPERGSEYKMGGQPSSPKNGTFYVRTNSEPPYALGKIGNYVYA